MIEIEKLSPVVKWAGGKRWLVERMRAWYEPHRHRRFVEPFAGGAAISLALLPQRVLLNDINPYLVNLYKWLRVGMPVEEMSKFPAVELRNDRDTYNANRTRFNALVAAKQHERIDTALLFWYLNRTCFNGLCRFNKRGEFNVPFGLYKNIDYAGMIENFPRYAEIMNGWGVSHRNFNLVQVLPTDFLYVDPPYDRAFTQYNPEGFTWYDQVKLAKWLDRHEGPIVVSNSLTDRVVALYQKRGFEIYTVPAPRRISCNGNREKALEMLAVRGL